MYNNTYERPRTQIEKCEHLARIKFENPIERAQRERDERVQAMLHFRETGDEELYLFMTTRNGTVKRLEDGRLLVRFLSEASAIAPGQSAVFYVGRRVVGGSFIASQRGIGMYIAENNKNTDI